MPIPSELATACADVRPAGDADSIAGRPARFVAAPASTEEASALLLAATALGLTVVPRGAGRLQHWGNPPDSCDLIVDTRRLNRIVEHRPDDLAVTVQAGVLLRDLERELAPAHQTTALFPPKPAYAGTVGGLIATNAAGSHRYRYGTPRDRLTGITAVLADGTIVADGDANDGTRPSPGRADGGERDLIALLAGSFGSLGLITEATFRLEPTPQVAHGTTIPCDGPEHAQRLVAEVADPRIAPLGIDLRWPSTGEPLRLFAAIHGSRADVTERVSRVYALAGRAAPPPIDRARARLDDPDHGGLPADVAQRLLARQAEIRAEVDNPSPDTGTMVRISYPPARLASTLTRIRAVAAETGVDPALEGSAVTGVLDVRVPAATPASAVAWFVDALRAELTRLAAAGSASESARGFQGARVVRAVVVYAPDEVRDLIDAHGPVPALALLQAVKDELDPEHRMAPGRLADAL